MPSNQNILQTRIDMADHARLLALAKVMGERAGGLVVSRAEVIRLCVLRGLESYEQQFGVASKPKRTTRP